MRGPLLALMVSALSAPVPLAAQPATVEPGHTIYDHQCAPYHARATDKAGNTLLGPEGYPLKGRCRQSASATLAPRTGRDYSPTGRDSGLVPPGQPVPRM
jgi:hypothetical protein